MIRYPHHEHPGIPIVSNVMDGDRHVDVCDAGRYRRTRSPLHGATGPGRRRARAAANHGAKDFRSVTQSGKIRHLRRPSMDHPRRALR